MAGRSDIRSRIVGHGEAAPDQLLAHPQNFRRHPGEQMEVLRDSLDELGWFRSIIVNKRTGHVIDGHARVLEAMRRGQKVVPVEYVDMSEAEENLALAVGDPIAEMARRDDDVLASLLEDVEAKGGALQGLLAGMASEAADVPAPGAVEELDLAEVDDRFWVSVRGPLPAQMDVLERLRAALEELPGVEVDVGTSR